MKIPIAFIALATLCGQVAALVKITSYLTANCDGPSVSQVFDHYPGHELKMAVGAGSANGARGWRVWFDNYDGLYTYGQMLGQVVQSVRTCPDKTDTLGVKGDGCIPAPDNCIVKEIMYGRS